MRKCSKCKLDKNESEFNIRKDRKSGFYSSCKGCMILKSKLYREKNREKIKVYNDAKKENYRDYYISNKERILKNRKIYYIKNKEIIDINNKKYSIENSDKLKKYSRKYLSDNKYKINKRKVDRRKIDPIYRIRYITSNLIRDGLKRNGYGKKSKTQEILGCIFEEFKTYLESKFEPWMNWENWGKYNGELNYGWDIDHIIPISSAKTEEEILELNNFRNLQPLDSKINRDIKNSSIRFYLE